MCHRRVPPLALSSRRRSAPTQETNGSLQCSAHGQVGSSSAAAVPTFRVSCGQRALQAGVPFPAVAMRSECKHYESRTYPGGETVRKCKIDLAPEAPWNCPADCAGFELRM